MSTTDKKNIFFKRMFNFFGFVALTMVLVVALPLQAWSKVGRILEKNLVTNQARGHILVNQSGLLEAAENWINKSKNSAQIMEDISVVESSLPFKADRLIYVTNWENIRINGFDANSNTSDMLNVDWNLPEVNIKVENLKIDTVITQEISGAIVNVRVQTVCEEINFKTQADQMNLGMSVTNSNDQLFVSLSQLRITSPRVQIQNFKCSQINGIENEISSAIRHTVERINFYKPLIVNKLQGWLQKNLDQTSSQVLTVLKTQLADPNIKIRMNVFLNKKNYWDFTYVVNSPAEKITPLNPSHEEDIILKSILNQSNLRLILINSKDQLENALNNGAQQVLAQQKWSSKNIRSLDKLMNSRFMQFFIWPGLMKLPKGAELELTPELESIKIEIPESVLIQQLTASVTGGIHFSFQQKDMIYFRSQAQVLIQQTADQPTLQIRDLDSHAHWNEDFVESYQCSHRVWSGLIDQMSEKYFNQNVSQSILSPLKVNNDLEFKIESFYLSKNKNLFTVFAKKVL